MLESEKDCHQSQDATARMCRGYRIFGIGRKYTQDSSRVAASHWRKYYAMKRRDSGDMYTWIGDVERLIKDLRKA